MGYVYKAHDTQLSRTVALKKLRSQDEETDITRFLREAKATANLRHPNIVAVYDIGQHEGEYYFTMDFVEGSSLEELLKKKKISLRQKIKTMIKVSEAVHYAHSKGIVHRDLKPANILMDSERGPLLGDFGLAKVINETSVSATGTIVGTPNYIAPEVWEGKTNTPQADRAD